MNSVSRKLTFTILSMSLLTVMAGAAIAPALGVISQHFSDASPLKMQFIVSMPALFIIITNLFFTSLCKVMKTRTLAVMGLVLYVVAGAGAYFVDDINVLLAFRAVLGISVGMIMPLSTGLLSYYYPPEEQARLMGLAAAMNQMGGVVATLLAGVLANISWNNAFLVYLLGLIAVVLVVLFLPNERLVSKSGKMSMKTLVRFHPSVIGMFLLMCIFFVYPTNFAVIASRCSGMSGIQVTLVMVGLDFIAFLVGLFFGNIIARFRRSVKYFAAVFFLLGYLSFCLGDSAWFQIIGSAFIGIANGIGVPYLNTIASIKGGKESATTVMPLISASLYLGQFLSPVIVSPLSHVVFGENDIHGPYKIAVALCLLFLIQVFVTRKSQSQPPVDDDASGN